MSHLSDSSETLARGYLDAAFDLRRVLRAHLPESGTDETLPLAQAEVVRTVLAFPDSRIGDIAERLKLRANTVSTLVRTLVEKGLLERHPDPADGRAVVLRVNEERTARRARRTDRRVEVLAAEIAKLSAADRRAVERAMPALVRLNEGLRQRTA